MDEKERDELRGHIAEEIADSHGDTIEGSISKHFYLSKADAILAIIEPEFAAKDEVDTLYDYVEGQIKTIEAICEKWEKSTEQLLTAEKSLEKVRKWAEQREYYTIVGRDGEPGRWRDQAKAEVLALIDNAATKAAGKER